MTFNLYLEMLITKIHASTIILIIYPWARPTTLFGVGFKYGWCWTWKLIQRLLWSTIILTYKSVAAWFHLPWCLLVKSRWSRSCPADSKTLECADWGTHDGWTAHCECRRGTSDLYLQASIHEYKPVQAQQDVLFLESQIIHPPWKYFPHIRQA